MLNRRSVFASTNDATYLARPSQARYGTSFLSSSMKTGGRFNKKKSSPIVEIRPSYDRLISTIGFPIHVLVYFQYFILNQGPHCDILKIHCTYFCTCILRTAFAAFLHFHLLYLAITKGRFLIASLMLMGISGSFVMGPDGSLLFKHVTSKTAFKTFSGESC